MTNLKILRQDCSHRISTAFSRGGGEYFLMNAIEYLKEPCLTNEAVWDKKGKIHFFAGEFNY